MIWSRIWITRFIDGTFDLIFSSNLLEHIPDLNRCLEECRRVLKDDGLMLHTMPSRWWKLFYSTLNMVKFKRPTIHGTSTSHCQEFYTYGLKVWITRIESIGLRVIDAIGLPFYVGHFGRSYYLPIIKAGNIFRLPASYLYVIKKK